MTNPQYPIPSTHQETTVVLVVQCIGSTTSEDQ